MTTPSSINVKVLFFGAAKDLAGADEKSFKLQPGIRAAEAFAVVSGKIPALGEKFGKSLLFAINQNYAAGEEIINDGDELAIFPPVSGGASQILNPEVKSQNGFDFYEITFDQLDVGAIAERVRLPECGATVTLDGYVRQWTRNRETLYLAYEAYEPMALSEMQKLGAGAREQFEISAVGIVHRLGRLEINETSVCIAVSAPHRRAAFAACEWLIKELKRTVPIWKKEFYADENGEPSASWIAGEKSGA